MQDEKRPDKTGCFTMRFTFDDAEHCHIRVTDRGFGEFYPASEKTVERIFNMNDESLETAEVPESGRLIITESCRNTVPYYFNLSGMRVYTLEQLCYYIYHHIYTITPETFSDDLFYWIEKNIGDKGLVKRLREAKKNERTLKELVRLVLMSVDYYSKTEIAELQKTIEEIEMQNPVEARKVEADNYLRYGRNLEALSVYKKVEWMMENTDEIVTDEFQGNVYHNMGIAFARLANGEAALSCFKRAYELNESEASRDSWLMMLKLLGREEELHQETNRLLLSPELVDEIEQKLSELQEDFEKQPVYEMLDQLKDIRDESQWDEVCPEILGWLEKQKEEYRGL
jgi:tetratricopeptide (TPR) repeat protein